LAVPEQALLVPTVVKCSTANRTKVSDIRTPPRPCIHDRYAALLDVYLSMLSDLAWGMILSFCEFDNHSNPVQEEQGTQEARACKQKVIYTA
jgi:hypothetical protein